MEICKIKSFSILLKRGKCAQEEIIIQQQIALTPKAACCEGAAGIQCLDFVSRLVTVTYCRDRFKCMPKTWFLLWQPCSPPHYSNCHLLESPQLLQSRGVDPSQRLTANCAVRILELSLLSHCALLAINLPKVPFPCLQCSERR